MRLSRRSLSFVAAGLLAAVGLGCEDTPRKGPGAGTQPTETKVQVGPDGVKVDVNKPGGKDVNVDVGGGKGVNVDVDNKKPGGKDVNVDVGGGKGVDVDVEKKP